MTLFHLLKTRFLLIATILTWSILTGGQFCYAKADYVGNPGQFDISISKTGKDASCSNTFTISQIEIRVTHTNSVKVSFTISWPAPGGVVRRGYSEVGTISNGSANFPSSKSYDRSLDQYYWCQPLQEDRLTFWQPAITGITFGARTMNVNLTISLNGQLEGSRSTNALLTFQGEPGLYYKNPFPYPGYVVCSSEVVLIDVFGDSPVKLSLYIIANGSNAKLVDDILSDGGFAATKFDIPVKLSNYFPNLNDGDDIKFELRGFSNPAPTPSLKTFNPLSSGITLTTNKGDNPVLCEPSAITLEVKNAPGGSSINWPDSGPNLANPESKTYRAEVYKTNGSGAKVCPPVTVSTNVKIFALTASIKDPNPKNKCEGETIDLSAEQQGDFKYTWKLGSESVGEGPSFPAKKSGSYTVTIKSNQATTCPEKVSSPVSLTFDPPVDEISIGTPNGLVICGAPEATTIRIIAAPNGLTYSWQREGGGFSDNKQTVDISMAGKYTLTGSRGACSRQYTFNVQDNSYTPSITTIGSNPYCSDTPITLKANPADASTYDYKWTFDAKSVGSGPEITLSTQVGSLKYTVEISGKGTTCKPKTSEITVTASQAIADQTISVQGKTRPIICGSPETSIGLLVSSAASTEGVSYNWQGPGVNATGTNITASNQGEYKVIATRGACRKETSVKVESGAFTPTINIENALIVSQADVRICEGKSAVLKSAADGTVFGNNTDNFEYNWYGGATASSLLSSHDPTLQLTASGQYRLEMTLKGSGCPAKKATPDPIKVSVDPEIKNTAITPNPAIICNKTKGLVLSAVADNGSGVTYQWSAGGTAGTDPSKYTIFNGGTYTVTYTRGACRSEASVSPKEEILEVNVTAPNQSKPILICSGTASVPIELKAVSNLSTAEIKWMLSDGKEAPGNNTGTTYIPTQTGTYYATANFNGICDAVSNQKIETKAISDFSVSITSSIPSPVCDDRAITLTSAASEKAFLDQYQYDWTQDGKIVSTGTGPAFATLNTGRQANYTNNSLVLENESSFTLAIKKDGCKALSPVNKIVLKAARTAIIALDYSTLEATESADKKYQWYFKADKNASYMDSTGYQPIALATAQTLIVPGLGSYMVRANRNECGARFSFAYAIDLLTPVEPSLSKQWRVYPNPSIDAVTIENLDGQNPKANVEIRNTSGQMMMSKKQNNALQSYSMRQLPTGIYFIEIQLQNQKIIRKIIKQ